MKSASSSQDLDFGVTVQLNCAVASNRGSLFPVAGRFSLLSPKFAQVSSEYCTLHGLAPLLAPVTYRVLSSLGALPVTDRVEGSGTRYCKFHVEPESSDE